MSTLTMGAYEVEVSNEGKVYFPDCGITKGEVVDYYRRIAEIMLPHMRDRPVVMQRAPEGMRGQVFFQKETPDYFPDWIRRVKLRKEGGHVAHVICRKTADLAYLANQGVITPHTWLSRFDKPNEPDRLVIDLDPSRDDFELVRRTATSVRELLEQAGLAAFLMTTGSRGLHVVSPLRRGPVFDDVRAFARHIAGILAKRHPDELTVEHRKEKRGDRVFLDANRNAYAQTAVTPYSVRRREGAPIATPLEWDELDDAELTPTRYHIRNIFARLGRREDPWADIQRHARGLPDRADWPPGAE